MLGHFLKAFVLWGLPLCEAGRLRKWWPRFHESGGAGSTFSRSGAFWLPVNESILDDVLPDDLNSKKLKEALNRDAGHMVCGENPPVDSGSERRKCPASCPMMAEKKGNGVHCDFHCIEATSEACTAMDDEMTVVDMERGFCRPCAVMGCSECLHDGTDTCVKCSNGFYLDRGECVNPFWWCWWLFGATVLIIVSIIVVWVVDLVMRPVTNKERLDHALALRSRAKLRQPKKQALIPSQEPPPGEADDPNDNRPLWPLKTNLCRDGRVAGPGLVLSFNFQVFVIMWALVMGLGWMFLGVTVDTDLFIMGTRRWDSPRQQCMVIAWGYETQHRLLWTKIAYLAFGYTFTFLGSLLFSIRQLRIFQRMDLNMSTHKDFCAVASGLSGLSGEEKLEEELKAFFEKETGKTVIAVSISWVYMDCENEIMDLIDKDMLHMHRRYERGRHGLAQSPKARGAKEGAIEEEAKSDTVDSSDSEFAEKQKTEFGGDLDASIEQDRSQALKTRLARSVESVFLSTPVQKALTRGRAKGFDLRHGERSEDGAAGDGNLARSETLNKDKDMKYGEEHNQKVVKMLGDLKTSGKVFIIFNTEQDRDDVVANQSPEGMAFRDKTVKLTAAMVEPEGVSWQNFSDETEPFGLTKKVLGGMVSIGFALCIWAGVFYLPFVWISASASYTYGSAPSELSVFTFSMIVVAGNAMMYTTCSEVTDRMRFPYRKDHEVTYMLFYTVSCVFNVILDLVITCFIAYWHLAGVGTRMYGGQPINEAPTAVALLMTYGMQRELGENTMAYSWPGTFLIPFLLEPIAAVYLPYQLMKLLVSTHSDIHTASAEAYLASIPFDLSRYADIHLNVILAVLILFFPGGYNLTIFFGLAIAHVWIYCYDHVRVLRFCPGFTYASIDVDKMAQWMFCFPCALLLCAFMWKYNQELEFWISKTIFGSLGDPQHSSIGVTVLMVATFALHVLLHTWLLENMVPMFGIKQEHEGPEDTYRQCAQRLPCSWLSSNPVACLRSDYIYRHKPPIVFCEQGKEHLMLVNEAAGQFFEDVKSKAEDADEWSPSQVFSMAQFALKRLGSKDGADKADEGVESKDSEVGKADESLQSKEDSDVGKAGEGR